MESPVSHRFVPGAPPPTPLSKSQKKKLQAKRKPGSPAVESQDNPHVPVVQSSPIENVPVKVAAPEPVAQSEPQPPLEEESYHKPSPIVELINKRLKVTAKKISRVSTYATMDAEKLNDDQRRTLKTLPGLEAVQKELAEVKKAVEVHEAELVHELASKRIEAEEAEKKKLAEALSATENSFNAKTSDILSFLRLYAALSAGHPEALTLNLDEATGAAILAVGETLQGNEGQNKHAAIHGFLSGEGDFQGTTYAELLEITRLYINPPRLPTPMQEGREDEEDEDQTKIQASMVSTVASEADIVVGGIPAKPSTGSFHFMQASELEPSFEDSAEWIERPDSVVQEAEELQPLNEEVAELANDMGSNDHRFVEEPGVAISTEDEVPPSTTGVIDWADEEAGLPSIDVLHAKFGTSGSATPVTPVGEAAEFQDAAPMNGIHANGVSPSHEEDDGFTQARGGRGRGRGSRGDRGMRSGFRGGRGDRGRGGFRGGDRDRGSFRGRSASSGEWREDGEYRGRGGRGRGRGGRGDGAPQAS